MQQWRFLTAQLEWAPPWKKNRRFVAIPLDDPALVATRQTPGSSSQEAQQSTPRWGPPMPR